MSGTREHFLGTPVATVEAGTKLTPEGQAANQLHDRIRQLDPEIPWVRTAQKQYAQNQRNMMSGQMMRKGRNKALGTSEEPSLISQLARQLTRDEVQNAIRATFRGDPNVKHIGIFGRKYESDLITSDQYEGNINVWNQRRERTGNRVPDAGRSGRARNTA